MFWLAYRVLVILVYALLKQKPLDDKEKRVKNWKHCENLTATFLCWLKRKEKQGRIHGTSVAEGWAGAVMQKPLGIQKCDLPTDRRGKF